VKLPTFGCRGCERRRERLVRFLESLRTREKPPAPERPPVRVELRAWNPDRKEDAHG
jgi:hypothetical protein